MVLGVVRLVVGRWTCAAVSICACAFAAPRAHGAVCWVTELQLLVWQATSGVHMHACACCTQRPVPRPDKSRSQGPSFSTAASFPALSPAHCPRLASCHSVPRACSRSCSSCCPAPTRHRLRCACAPG